MIVFVFGQLPDNRPVSPAQGGYPVPNRPVSSTALPAQGGYPGPDRPASPTAVPATASLEEHMVSETTEAQWLATHAPWKLRSRSAEMDETQAAKATAFSLLPPIDTYITSPPGPTHYYPLTLLQRPAGAGRIIEGMSGQDLQMTFISTNAWIERTADKYILVWAGFRRYPEVEGLKQGAVIVEWLSLSSLSTYQRLPGGGMFVTPTQAGAVVIVDAVGEELTLRAIDGTTFYFNVASQEYVSHKPTLPAQRQAGNGIVIENGTVPFSPPGLRFLSQWARQNGDQRLTVFVGVEGGNNREWGVGQGVLAIVSSTGQPTATDKPALYYSPETHGPLRVFEVVDDQLILVGAFGSTAVFDLNTQRFLTRSEMKLPRAPLFDDGTSSLPIK